MPWDLYGNYYKSEIDAINAETAQMAEIDARNARRDIAKLQRDINRMQEPNDRDYAIAELIAKVGELEDRIEMLEKANKK